MGVAMVLRPELRVSVDVGCHRHSAAVGLTDLELLEDFDIDHRPEEFATSSIASTVISAAIRSWLMPLGYGEGATP